ncbi:MAG: DUF998 domain-containing protein [Candidatus Lokiarchaeota archaeon]|nr:DUF998 domain-containing protein [Candidatus Lokiarchaeota archaeon]
MILYQILAICGMLSPIVYTLMWIYVGSLDSEYNHIRDDISSLFAIGAPKRRLAQIFIIVSSVLLLLFYLGLHEGLNDGGGSVIGPSLLVASSILGVFVALFFPLDEGGEIKTYRGKLHVILVVASGILTIIGMVALWLRLQSVTFWNGFAIFSLVSAIVSAILITISGIFARGKYRGILERFGVTPYQVYYFVLGLMVFLAN